MREWKLRKEWRELREGIFLGKEKEDEEEEEEARLIRSHDCE